MSEPMTDADLAEMRARAEAATPGPWEKPLRGFFGSQIYSSSTQDDVIAEGVSIDDAAFIVHAREDVPRLLAEVERLWAENAALKEIVRAVAHPADDHSCQYCGRWETTGEPHYASCPVTAARALLASPNTPPEQAD